MQSYDDPNVPPGYGQQAVPTGYPVYDSDPTRLRGTLICQIILGTFIPFVSFVCGIILLVKSATPSKASGWAAATGILSLFWMPIISAIFALITLIRLSSHY